MVGAFEEHGMNGDTVMDLPNQLHVLVRGLSCCKMANILSFMSLACTVQGWKGIYPQICIQDPSVTTLELLTSLYETEQELLFLKSHT